jgi:hypothetical protein
MSTQIAGATVANIAEVEAATKALRVVLRPDDYGALGVYSLGGTSGVMAAGLAGNAIVFGFRYSGSNVLLLKRVRLSMGGIVGFTAGVATFNMFIDRSFSVNHSGQTTLNPSGNSNKLRTSTMGAATSLLGAISTTAALTTGTRTVDPNPCASLAAGASATAGTVIVPPGTILFEQRPGEYPLLFANNEGFEIQATVPATGTWTFSVDLACEELASYS